MALASTQVPLFTWKDLENRASAAVVKRIADDDKSGAADRVVIQQLIKDASSVVWAYLPATYVVGTPVPDYIQKLALDVAQAMLYIRFPQSALGANGFEIMNMAYKDLERFAAGTTNVPQVTGSGGSGGSGGGGSGGSDGGGVVVSDRPSRRNLDR